GDRISRQRKRRLDDERRPVRLVAAAPAQSIENNRDAPVSFFGEGADRAADTAWARQGRARQFGRMPPSNASAFHIFARARRAHFCCGAYVGFWHFSDIKGGMKNVRFLLWNGHSPFGPELPRCCPWQCVNGRAMG